MDWNKKIASCMGPIQNIKELFLQGIQSDHQSAVASSMEPFDLETWLSCRRDDNVLPLSQ